MPVTACTRQLVPGGSGIAPSIRFVAGSPVSNRWTSSQPVELSGTAQSPLPCGCSTAHRFCHAPVPTPAPVCASLSVSIASAATVEFAIAQRVELEAHVELTAGDRQAQRDEIGRVDVGRVADVAVGARERSRGARVRIAGGGAVVVVHVVVVDEHAVADTRSSRRSTSRCRSRRVRARRAQGERDRERAENRAMAVMGWDMMSVSLPHPRSRLKFDELIV